MSDQPKEVKYFALPEDVINEVLNHLNTNPTVSLFNKVRNALPVKQAEPKETPTT